MTALLADPAIGTSDVFRRIIESPAAAQGATPYAHWDKLRHLEPPEGLTHEQWWLGTKLRRQSDRRVLPLRGADGRPFSYTLPDVLLRALHFVDQRCSGTIAMGEVVTADDHARRHYLVNSLMEEAIRSSQLEGATTSRKAAKELLRTGREPLDRSERMILNNYAAMLYMREMGDTLTPGAIVELQRILTDGTLDNPDAAGRLQRPDEDRVAVVTAIDGSVVHRPPPAVELPGRLEAMCDFANADDDAEQFVHPVVRGVLLHFWLAYDHPFEDGNGRTARALFYWFMRVRGYWLAEYLSISRILRKAPAQYARSFLLTETDDGDTTYFLLAQLAVVEQAIRELQHYLARKVSEIRDVEQLVGRSTEFNQRQLALLSDALRAPDRSYTFGGHARSHQMTHETARTDVSGLADRGLLERRRTGRGYRFLVPGDLAARLQAL